MISWTSFGGRLHALIASAKEINVLNMVMMF